MASRWWRKADFPPWKGSHHNVKELCCRKFYSITQNSAMKLLHTACRCRIKISYPDWTHPQEKITRTYYNSVDRHEHPNSLHPETQRFWSAYDKSYWQWNGWFSKRFGARSWTHARTVKVSSFKPSYTVPSWWENFEDNKVLFCVIYKGITLPYGGI